MTKNIPIAEPKTSTEELVRLYYATTNPVTRSGYREMIAERLGITENKAFFKKLTLQKTLKFMQGLTYSFDSRKRMEEYFEKWYMM